MTNQVTNMLKCVGGMYRVSYLETFCEKKSGKKLQGKTTGGLQQLPPLGRIRVKQMETVSNCNFQFINQN